MSSRYKVDGAEGMYEPGSDGKVLANKLHITDPQDMDDAELGLLEKLYELVLELEFPNRTLRTDDLKTWHRRWLGNLYVWAGELRSVNMSKDGFPFAAAAQLERVLGQFEREYLSRYTPCHETDDAALAEAIAHVHAEFILIHPFREGNGRLSRLLANVMAVQAGHQPLDFSSWDAAPEVYFSAIQQGVAGNIEAMKRLVLQALRDGDQLARER